MVADVVDGGLCGPINRPLCPPKWADAVSALIPPIVSRNSQMFDAFPEYTEDDLLNEAQMAGCRSWRKFDPRKAAPSRFIRLAVKRRLIDLYRQGRLKHRRDRDYAPRQQSRVSFDLTSFSRALSRWLREREEACSEIPGDIFAICKLYRLLSRPICRLEKIMPWKDIPQRLRQQVTRSQYHAVATLLRNATRDFAGAEGSRATHLQMDRRTAAAHSSAFAMDN